MKRPWTIEGRREIKICFVIVNRGTDSPLMVGDRPAIGQRFPMKRNSARRTGSARNLFPRIIGDVERRKIREKFPSPRNFEEDFSRNVEGRIRGRGREREDRMRSSIPRGGVGDSSRKLWRAAGIRVEHTLRTSFIFDPLPTCAFSFLPSFPFIFQIYIYTRVYACANRLRRYR